VSETYYEPDSNPAALDALVRASRLMLAIAIQSLAVLEIDLTLLQYRSLVIIAQHPECTVSALASALGVSHPTASRLCDRLCEKGLIDRRQSTLDRRRVELSLFPKAVEALDAVTTTRRSQFERLLEMIPKHKWKNIEDALNLISDAANEPREESWR
jgi:DNA-binding MarR family transcriptional regulator